ncbi:ubiquitin transferase, putative [Plasmodium knowlesi strain H]|uniref:HECT-type E3 ubiquitin transferase n=3 Tax=Plasmodium knowlesi TaxID=5850 RepID=A0A5K1U7F5_PLAKH|nr:ubiquitin transferase, putative [Plasmodium knowlesi strain H]OTN65206.1 putative Ubiquitin transferase [Plasmodium knowlesi]CAA9988218.1 ubiquitin transferase, putative [Plasmodium knowlesi strain H]SBO20143.1 ubiquitin transferase, putative [Plasmodium knowlesi strain H]SBO20574.1 ubiquitin transferase, putative [Plasmodium knowlesi strain H]VVS77692.1 ubiquitin transferase, putative [Plasmodium knowlesi strain H]|eukprot:XP_002259195.1 ubiquitin-protein ligase, putative [Plasmodium knowlesi strain H]
MFNGESKSRKINLSGKKNVILNKDSFIERAKKEKEIHLNLTRRKNAFKIIGNYVRFKKCIEKRRNEIKSLIGKRISDVMLLQNLVAPDVYERALRICLHEFSLSSTFLYSSPSCYYYYKGMNFVSLYPPVKYLLDVLKLYGKVGQLDEPHSVREAKTQKDATEQGKHSKKKEEIHVRNKFLYRHKKEIQVLLNHLDVLLGEYNLYGENIYGEYRYAVRNVSCSQGKFSPSVDAQRKKYDNGQMVCMYHMYNFILNKSFCVYMEKEIMNSLEESTLENNPRNDKNVLESLHKISDYIILTMDGIINILRKLLLSYEAKQIAKCSSTKLLIYLCDLIYIFLFSLKMKGKEIKQDRVEEVKGKVNLLLQFLCICVDNLKDCHSLYIAFFKYPIYDIFSTPIDLKKELGMMKLLLLKIVNRTYSGHHVTMMQELIYSNEKVFLHLDKYHLFNHASFDGKNISGVNLFKNMLLFVQMNEAMVQDNALNILLECYLFLSLRYHPYVYKVCGEGREKVDGANEVDGRVDQMGGNFGIGGGNQHGDRTDGDGNTHINEEPDFASLPSAALWSNTNPDHNQTEDIGGKKRSASFGGGSWEQSSPNKKKEVNTNDGKAQVRGLLSHMGFYYTRGVVDSLVRICKKGGFKRLDALMFLLLPFRTIHKRIFHRYRNYYEFVKSINNQQTLVIGGRRNRFINQGGVSHGENRREELSRSGSLPRGSARGSLISERASSPWNGSTYGLLSQTKHLSKDQSMQKTTWGVHKHIRLFSLRNLIREKGKRGKRLCDGDLLSNDIILKMKKILIEHDMHIYLVREVYLLWFINCKGNDTQFFKYLSAFPYFDHTIVSIYISSLCFLLHYYVVANMFVNLIDIQSFKLCKNFMSGLAFKKVCKLLLMSLWVILKKSMYAINCEVVNRLACEEKGIVGVGEDSDLEELTEAINEEDTYNDEDEQFEREMNRKEERAIEEIESGVAHQEGGRSSDGECHSEEPFNKEDLCEPLRCYQEIPITLSETEEAFFLDNAPVIPNCRAEDLLEELDSLGTDEPSSMRGLFPSSAHHLMNRGMHFSSCDTYDGIGIANKTGPGSGLKSSIHNNGGGEDASAIISTLISYLLYNGDRRGLNCVLPRLLKKLYKVNGYVHLFEEDFFVIKETSNLLKNRFNIIGDQNNGGSSSNQMNSANTWSSHYDSESHLFIDKNDAYLNYNIKHVNELANYLLRFTPFTLPFDDRILIFYNNRNKSKESIRDDSRFSLVDVKHHLIRRTHIVEDAYILLHTLDSTQVKQNIRVAFIDHSGNEETGIDGGGLFKEFMILLCREIFHSKFFLFDYVHNGTLYPKRFHSNDNLNLYTFAGKVIGKAIYERILIESVFNDVFLSFLLCDDINLDVDIDINDLYFIDKHVFKSLLYIQNTPHVENLSLTFCIYERKKPDVGDVRKYEDIISYFQALEKQISGGTVTGAVTGAATSGGNVSAGRAGGNVVRHFFSQTGMSPDHDNINSFFNIIDNLDALIHTLDRNLSSLSPVPLEDDVLPHVNRTERHPGANYNDDSPMAQMLLRRNELNSSPTSNGVLLGSDGEVLTYPLRNANDVDSEGGKGDPSGGGIDDPSGGGMDDPSGGGMDDPSGGGIDDPSGGGMNDPSGGGMNDPSGGGKCTKQAEELECIDLIQNGRNILVDDKNKKLYIKLYINYKFKKMVQKKTQAFLKGLSELIPSRWLKLFNAHELKTLISGNDKCFDVDDLKRNVVYGGGYNGNSQTVINLYDILKTFSPKEKSLFLMFVTSCSRSPLLGFQELYPKFCIFRVGDHTRLPTASTCVNLLKLPDYASREILRKNLLTAISGTQGFDLS